VFLRRRCLAGVKPKVLLYGAQNGVCPAATGGGYQVRKGVLGVGGFIEKHGERLQCSLRYEGEQQRVASAFAPLTNVECRPGYFSMFTRWAGVAVQIGAI
jgi:hypothetical protein